MLVAREEREKMSENFDPTSCRVALLAGGKSGEREVSLASGEGARAALEEAGFQVTSLDPADKEDLKRLIDGNFDVAFLCVHGKYGEDGTLQGLLELIGLPYTGSGVWSSAASMNKIKSKWLYERAGLLTSPMITMKKGDVIDADAVVAKLGNHCVVKPGSAGSALGVHIVEEKGELLEALEEAFKFDDEILIERYIQGTELTVAVIGGNEVEALPIIEILPSHEFYDYESKYAPGGSRHICPARLDEETSKRIQEYAVRAHKALECRGMSRSDFILDEEDKCWILETNTIPGMTSTSLLPDAARAAGISFPDLCIRLVEIALSQED